MVSKKEQDILQQAQIYQQQMQGILIQKETLSMQLFEIKKALEELKKSKETTDYKIAGPILIKSKKSDVEKDLKEKEAFINIRMKTLEKGEDKVKEKLDELREDFSGKAEGAGSKNIKIAE